jgi:short-subunit dehydrogenase
MSKVVLITGISSGFGKAISEFLSEKDYKVYGISRKPLDVKRGIVVLKGDVTNRDSINKAVAELLEHEKRIDVLINNAGMGIGGPIEYSSLSEIGIQMDTNFTGTVNTIQAVLPIMRQQRNGMILNVSSIGGIMGLPFQGFYSASKFAVEGLSESLRMELRKYNIKVVVIRPGDFFTNFTANRKVIDQIPSGNSYDRQFQQTLAVIEKDEKSGLNPSFLARKIAQIIEKKNPAHTYVIASAEQKLAVLLKKMLPSSWFFPILESHYQIKAKVL